MRALFQWIESRTGVYDAWRRFADHPVPGGACVSRAGPAAILFTFLVQAVTGLVAWIYYAPNDQTAWESVYYLQHEVAGGWLLRAIHHYGGHVLLVLVIGYLLQMVFTRACRVPRELVFWSVVGMGLVCLASLLTGDLLTWSQNSYAATHVRVNFLTQLPEVGYDLFKIAIGGPGPSFGHLTLPRFLALHIGVFAGGFFLLILLHGILASRADRRASEAAERTSPRWPSQTMFGALACLVVMAVILGLSARHGISGEEAGVALGSPADPANKYAAARPEWAFLGLYEMNEIFGKRFPGMWGGVPIFVVPTVLVLIVLVMPFLARFKVGHYFNVAVTILLLLVMGGLSYRCLARDAADEKHQEAIAAEVQKAQRVVQLARHGGGIPPAGGLALLKNDPKTQGPILFANHCAACHDYVGGGESADIAAEDSSAPNLYGFAGRAWIEGFLDPKRIATPEYFGNTAFEDGEMVDFVQSSLKELADEMGEEEFRKIVAALAEEAQHDAARPDDQIDEKVQFLFDDFTCTDCHKFHDSGDLGAAPDLTGYGSRAWLVGIISDPTHERFYSSENDRMPAYLSDPADPTANVLGSREVGLIADWLRGKWFEPPKP